MNFQKAIKFVNKIYYFLEKFNLESNMDIDSILDNNFPQIVSKLQADSNFEKIFICSTNGKRTVGNFFNQILEANNKTYATNIKKNGKLLPFLTSLFLEIIVKANEDEENHKKDYYTIANNFYQVFKNFKIMNFDILLLHNLFNYQTDNTSVSEKKKIIQSAIVLNSKLNLVINADDPAFYEIDNIKNDVNLTKKRNKFYYGFEEIEVFDKSGKSIQYNDLIRCPKCGCELEYKKRFYSHLGNYHCECGFRRPELNVRAKVRIFPDYSFLTVFYNENKMVFKVPLGSVYNAYNALAAIALALYLKIDRKTIAAAFDNYKPLKARDDVILKDNHKIKIKLIKNSVSFSEAIQELYCIKNKKLLFCFNSEFEDGLDTSWIWDSNLNILNNYENKIYITGKRFDDMALRLKYAGVNPSLITMDNSIKNAVSTCFYALESDEDMIIFTVPSLVDEIYKAIK